MTRYLIEFAAIVIAKNQREADEVGNAINECILPTKIEDRIETLTRTSPQEIGNDRN